MSLYTLYTFKGHPLPKIQITYKSSSIRAILELAVQNPEHRSILVAGINKSFKVTDQALIDLVVITINQKSVISAISKFIYDYLEPKHKALGNKASIEVTGKEYKVTISNQEAREETVTNTQEAKEETATRNQKTVTIY